MNTRGGARRPPAGAWDARVSPYNEAVFAMSHTSGHMQSFGRNANMATCLNAWHRDHDSQCYGWAVRRDLHLAVAATRPGWTTSQGRLKLCVGRGSLPVSGD
jgi:hypothetical protein